MNTTATLWPMKYTLMNDSCLWTQTCECAWNSQKWLVNQWIICWVYQEERHSDLHVKQQFISEWKFLKRSSISHDSGSINRRCYSNRLVRVRVWVRAGRLLTNSRLKTALPIKMTICGFRGITELVWLPCNPQKTLLVAITNSHTM